jgi:hypothetical protein
VGKQDLILFNVDGLHTVGKLTMQKIERTHLTLPTHLQRLARTTLGFSRSCLIHDLVIGLYMNHVEFGLPPEKGQIQNEEHYQETWDSKHRKTDSHS